MHFGVNGYVAHVRRCRQDRRQDEKDMKSKVTTLKRDLKTVKATLVGVAAWKYKYEGARSVLVSQELWPPLPQPLLQPLQNYEQDIYLGTSHPPNVGGVTRALCEYWEAQENATDEL